MISASGSAQSFFSNDMASVLLKARIAGLFGNR
jgi:hypothetical protein